MADDSINISPPFKFEIKTPPRGMTDYDPSAIHPNQQDQLNNYKLDLMRENIIYLARHPEVRGIFSWAGEYFWSVRPREILGSVGEKYTLPEPKFRQQMKKVIYEETLHIEDDLAESEDADWDY